MCVLLSCGKQDGGTETTDERFTDRTNRNSPALLGVRQDAADHSCVLLGEQRVDTNRIEIAVFAFRDILEGRLQIRMRNSNQLHKVMAQLSVPALLDFERQIQVKNRNDWRLKRILLEHLLRRALDNNERSRATFMLGDLLKDGLLVKEAIRAYEQCIALGDEGRSATRYLPALDGLAAVYGSQMGEHDKARTYYRKYKKLAEENNLAARVYQVEVDLALVDVNQAVARKNLAQMAEAVADLERLAGEDNKKFPFQPYAESRLKYARACAAKLDRQ